LTDSDGRNIVFFLNPFRWLWWSLADSGSGGTPERLPIADDRARRVSISRSGSRLVYERELVDLNIWRTAGPNSLTVGLAGKWIASTQQEGGGTVLT
jgi:hypothetical protein